jgi:hypothetical protein
VGTDSNWHGFPRTAGREGAQDGLSNRSNTMTSFSARTPAGRPREGNIEETGLGEDTEDLPLSPDEDMSVIPDEERVLDVPS